MIQQRNEIIAELYNSKDFNNCIDKMEPEHLREDLKQEIMVILLSKEPSLIVKLAQRGELNWYVVRIILNQVKSNSSPFVKKYRSQLYCFLGKAEALFNDKHFSENTTHSSIYFVTNKHKILSDHPDSDTELNIRLRRELAEQAAMRFISTELYWYDKKIVELYIRLGSYRLIEKETGIPWESCYGTVRRVQERIRKEVLNEVE